MSFGPKLAMPLAATVIALAACTPASTGSGTNPSGTGGSSKTTLTWAPGLFTTLHPYISISGSQRRYDIYDTVVRQMPDATVAPGVTSEWKNVDAVTWDLSIRQDMKFHDGTPMKADDVVFSINRAMDPDKKYAIAARLVTVKGVELANPTTVRVTTKAPDPIFLKRIALVSVLPKDYLTRVGDDEFSQKPIGTGPFKVVDYKDMDFVKLQAVPDHPIRKPKLTEVMVRNVPDSSARVAGLKTGELDIAEQIPLEQGKAFEASGFQVIALDTGNSEGYGMDTVVGNDPMPLPIRDKKVRQALNYAVDKDAIVKNIYQGYTKVEQCQIIQPESFGFNPNLKPYPYDPAKAKALLAEAGYPNGFKIPLRVQKSYAENEPTALFVQQQLKDIGVEVDYQVLGDIAIYRDYFYGTTNRTTLFRMSLTNRPALDADFAYIWFAGTQQAGTRHYNNPEFDKYYLASQQEMDEAKRRELLQKAGEVFCEDPPYLFLIQYSELIVGNNKIDGMVRRVDREQDLTTLSWK